MNTDKPILTITMPVFNNAECVKIMLDSIISNTFECWELIAVDDGSDEETLEMLNGYEETDNRIRIIKRTEQPKGAQTCRNIGLREAKGEYIAFYDSDDMITNDCLETRVTAISRRKDLDFMVFPSFILLNGKSVYEPYDKIYGYKANDDDIRAFCHRVLPFVVWNNIYRTESLRKYGIIWDTKLLSLQDADFNMQTLLKGLKYDYCNCPPNYAYRINQSGSITGKLLSGEHIKSNIYAIEKFYATVTSLHGHKYDKALYNGAMFIYYPNSLSQNAKALSEGISAILKKYDRKRFYIFKLQTSIAKILRNVCSHDLTKRIAFHNYLKYRFDIEKLVTENKILLENESKNNNILPTTVPHHSGE